MTNRKAPIQLRTDIDEKSARFAIDGCVRALWTGQKLTAHWKSEEHALGFGRFALDKSIHLALMAREKLDRPANLGDWGEIAERAERVSEALRDFVSWVGGSQLPPETWERPTVDWTAFSLLVAFDKLANAKGETLEAARSHAQTIASADQIMADFAKFARDRRTEMGATSNNPGDPVLAEFILRLAETWFLLTGKVPGSNARPESSRFLQFAVSAWEDAGGDPPTGATFGQAALKAAVPSLKAVVAKNPNYVPDWAR